MNVYQKTLLMLDACNLSGVAHSFSKEIVPAIWDEIHKADGGTKEFNKHPLAVLWTMKMVSLAAGECLCSFCVQAFGVAYAEGEETGRSGACLLEGEAMGRWTVPTGLA